MNDTIDNFFLFAGKATIEYYINNGLLVRLWRSVNIPAMI